MPRRQLLFEEPSPRRLGRGRAGLLVRGLIVAAAVLAVPAAAVVYRVASDATPPEEPLGAIASGWVEAPEPGAGPATPAGAEPMVMGMNIAGIVDWGTEWTFVDVFKHSREWIPQRAGEGPWDTKEPLELNEEGWPILKPGQAAGTLMVRECSPHYPAGRYVCTYEGRGKIVFDFAAKAVREEPGRIELDVRHDKGGIYLKIVESDPADPIRNIHVWMPGFENASSPFHPLFLERLRPFKVVRFMDWQRTNHSGVVGWEDRRLTTHARQAGPPGVALEYMIELCNELGADPWFCMPHLADDGFVRSFAEQVKRDLRPGATIYVEWSNEAWNSMFGQARWVAAEAARRGLEFPEVVADEALRDWKIWHEVFGDERGRIVRVAAGQQYNPRIARVMLERLGGEFDAVACGGYFYPSKEDERTWDATTTTEEILQSCLDELRERGLPRLAEHKKLADEWSARLGRDIPLLIYEGGQHLTLMGRETPYGDRFREAQRHPMMQAAYRELLSGFRDMGGRLFCAFASTGGWGKHGYWGHLEYQDQPLHEAPKYRVLLEYAEPSGAEGAVGAAGR